MCTRCRQIELAPHICITGRMIVSCAVLCKCILKGTQFRRCGTGIPFFPFQDVASSVLGTIWHDPQSSIYRTYILCRVSTLSIIVFTSNEARCLCTVSGPCHHWHANFRRRHVHSRSSNSVRARCPVNTSEKTYSAWNPARLNDPQCMGQSLGIRSCAHRMERGTTSPLTMYPLVIDDRLSNEFFGKEVVVPH